MICPHCKVKIEGISSTGPMAPIDGDLTICMECAQPSLFFISENAELGLRVAENKRELLECDIALGVLVAYATNGIEEDPLSVN